MASKEEVLNIPRLIEMIGEYEISYMQATPSLWSLVLDVSCESKLPIIALCGGEKLSAPLANKLVTSTNTAFNVYGPTETTVWSLIYPLEKVDLVVPIGMPIANTFCKIYDDQRKELPQGVVGELYIGGIGLARGYFNNPSLTDLKFTQNPRMYATGDLVYERGDGSYVYIARNDSQIKIRGFRVELPEIENVILQLTKVNQVVVIITQLHESETNQKAIVTYYVAENEIPRMEFDTHINNKLPDYMRPSTYIRIDRIPLNSNGKLDKKALPKPSINVDQYAQPSNEIEFKLCEIWNEALGLHGKPHNINVDFFDLGGNSILAIRLVNKINNVFKADLAIIDIFNQRTVANITQILINSIGRSAHIEFEIDKIDNENLYAPFPLNNVQQTYYFGRFSHFELSNVSTHIYSEYQYKYLDVQRLECAFNNLLNRHLSLRTIFTDNKQQYLGEVPYYYIQFNVADDIQQLLNIRAKLSHKLYEPDQYPLFDILVTKLKDSYILHISFDAIIIDMSSFQILFTEWTKLYRDPELKLPELKVSYRDYALKYEAIRNSNLFKDSYEYWNEKINQYNFDTQLPLRQSAAAIEKPTFKRLSKTIPLSIWQLIRDKAADQGLSPTAIVLEIYGKVFCYWSGQSSITINLTLFNRLPIHPQVNDIIGDFTVLELFNYILDDKSSIKDNISKTHLQLMEDIKHNYFDGVDVQRLIRKKFHIDESKIIAPLVLTSVLGNHNQEGLFYLPIDESYQGVYHSISQTSQVWIDNKAYVTREGFVAEWDYVDELFDHTVIQAMHESYCKLLIELASKDWNNDLLPSIPLSLDDTTIIQQANSETQSQSEDTLVSRYEQFVISNNLKEAPAVIESSTGTQFSYEKLLSDSLQLAKYLRHCSQNKPQQPVTLIGVLCEKGYHQVLATTAIMKAGYAYLPLHVEWPAARCAEVLAQGNVSILLISASQYNQTELRNTFHDYELVVIGQDHPVPNDVTLPVVSADDVAYVIFTSGSTGKPKGVTISHRGALNTIDAVNRRFSVTFKDKIFALSELSFDLSVYDIFGLLAVGGKIVFPEQDKTKEPSYWLDVVNRYEVTLWNSVPQLASLLADEMEVSQVNHSSLRVFLLSGDWIPTNLPARIHKECPDACVMSLGGATEGSIWSIWYEIQHVDPIWKSIPYGMAMPNQAMYVLNAQGEHAPIGVIGEIHIGGMGVALNYWGDKNLTQLKYINHPVLGRLYKTGDLGRWHKNGYIEFAGRTDSQVKLNGYRVELEEIANRITQISGVRDALVHIQKDHSHDTLVAYIVTDGDNLQLSDETKDVYKLEQHGLLTSGNTEYQCKPLLNLHEYCLRKSYRIYNNGIIEHSIISDEFLNIQKQIKEPKEDLSSNNDDIHQLMSALFVISALMDNDRALPKYRYPSAGQSYAVRCFVEIVTQNSILSSGCYYYHPVEHYFTKNDNNSIIQKAGISSKNTIYLVAHLPVFENLYGDQGITYASIEAGHMLSLITEDLDKNKVNYSVEIFNQDLDKINPCLISISLNEYQDRLPIPQLDYDLLDKTKLQSVINQASIKNNSVLSTLDKLLVISGDQTIENKVAAGFFAQRLSESLYNENIGSCMLGLKPYPKSLYSIAFGKINPNSTLEISSSALPALTGNAITDILKQTLPDYMIPKAFMFINEIPLTVNGKVAKNLLPIIETKRQYREPCSITEIMISEIWSDILKVDKVQIGLDDSFFALGGNSLHAMQFVQRVNSLFDVESAFKLNILYKYPTIASLMYYFDFKIKDKERVKGVL